MSPKTWKIVFLRPAARPGGLAKEIERVLPFSTEEDARTWTRLQAQTARWIIAHWPVEVGRRRQ